MDAVGADNSVRRRFLWTGDVGTAIYLLSCCNADPSMPTLDVF
jgi:hypothetical protein